VKGVGTVFRPTCKEIEGARAEKQSPTPCGQPGSEETVADSQNAEKSKSRSSLMAKRRKDSYRSREVRDVSSNRRPTMSGSPKQTPASIAQAIGAENRALPLEAPPPGDSTQAPHVFVRGFSRPRDLGPATPIFERRKDECENRPGATIAQLRRNEIHRKPAPRAHRTSHSGRMRGQKMGEFLATCGAPAPGSVAKKWLSSWPARRRIDAL
jgi:hypothetical protein